MVKYDPYILPTFTDPPSDRIAMISPLVIAMGAGGVVSCATVTRHVRLKPIPRSRRIGAREEEGLENGSGQPKVVASLPKR